ncbi:MAG: phenylalanine--tRNA ligase subunit beta [Candidatus Bipolaricaulia bacterium]
MRVPKSWLDQYVQTPVSTDELAHRLTLAGIELEEHETLPGDGLTWDHHVIGRVERVEAHPNADRLLLAHVDIGNGETRQVVHGAPNLPIGSSDLKVAVALPGARIAHAYDEDAEFMDVQATELRGAASNGVICSEYELGLSEHHEGVLILDEDAPVGTPLMDYLADEVLAFELTPNLGRCLSMIGMAREAAALTDGSLTIPEPAWTCEGPSAAELAHVRIDDPELCPRYTAAIVQDVEHRPTPFWMRYRLMQSGVRPLSLIVDITNYVMLEWGQPLHAFDYDKLVERADGREPTIIVRRGESGERLTTLDDVERELTDDMLVIADEAGPIAIAGVMGGANTEVTEGTEHILLESASFAAINNRRTSQALGLPSEASHRFSRGVPPELAERGNRRAAELMRIHAGGTVAEGLVDAYPAPPDPTVIGLAPHDVNRLLGMDLSEAEIIRSLEKLEFRCERENGILSVEAPSYRLDVGIPADLIEEVARAVGYDRLPSTRMREALPPQYHHPKLEGEERVRDILTGCGLTEMIAYRLTSLDRVAKLHPDGDMPDEPYIELSNPISSERTHMRRTLVDGLLATIADNQRHHDRIALFEAGRVYLPVAGADLPEEPRRLGIALAGRRHPDAWVTDDDPVDFYDLKGIIETLLARLNVPDAQFRPSDAAAFHPGRTAELIVEETAIGTLGEVHPRVADAFEIDGRAYVAELDLDRLLAHAVARETYDPIPRFPGIRQDLAIVVDAEAPSDRIEGLIRAHGGELLADVRLFDVYTGESIPEGKRSLAYSLLYRAEDRTLTDAEAQSIHERIQAALASELDAQVRGLGA